MNWKAHLASLIMTALVFALIYGITMHGQLTTLIILGIAAVGLIYGLSYSILRDIFK